MKVERGEAFWIEDVVEMAMVVVREVTSDLLSLHI